MPDHAKQYSFDVTLLKNGTGRERTGNGGYEVFNVAKSVKRNVPQNGNFERATLAKREGKKEDKYYLETYVLS